MRYPARRPRPRADHGSNPLFLSVLAIALIVVACGSTAGTASPPSTTPSTAKPTTPAASAPASAAPSASTPPAVSASPSGPPISQTDTAWGRIWDAIPAAFPRYPGGTTADDSTDEPVSAAYVLTGVDVAQLASWMQASVETATYSTEALSGPLEDGGYVLDSVGDGDCRIETRMAPQGTLVLVTVRYGAACPAP